MLKQTVEYTDFDENKQIEILYFNLTKSELADNLHLQTDLEELQRAFQGVKRDLIADEIKKIIKLVKTFMRLSYGVRSADGKRFVKTEEQWTEFTQTAAYDAFLFGLFEFPNRALEFMTGIMPKDIRDRAREEGERQVRESRAQNSEVIQAAISTKVPDAAAVTPSEIAQPIVQDEPAPVAVPADEVEAYNAWKAANANNGSPQ